jgi:hypothetical protein
VTTLHFSCELRATTANKHPVQKINLCSQNVHIYLICFALTDQENAWNQVYFTKNQVTIWYSRCKVPIINLNSLFLPCNPRGLKNKKFSSTMVILELFNNTGWMSGVIPQVHLKIINTCPFTTEATSNTISRISKTEKLPTTYCVETNLTFTVIQNFAVYYLWCSKTLQTIICWKFQSY